MIESGQKFVASKAISGVQTAIGIVVGLAIMVIALYYFLADGPAMIDAVMDLSPLDIATSKNCWSDSATSAEPSSWRRCSRRSCKDTRRHRLCFALPSEAPIFLLTALTMVTHGAVRRGGRYVDLRLRLGLSVWRARR